MNSRPLCMALIDAFMMLDSTGAEQLDPDLAIRTMENMSSSLLALSAEEQLELRDMICELASSFTGSSRMFVNDLPNIIGLKEPD